MNARPSPIEFPPNPWHADLIFPDRVKDDSDERKGCAQRLAEKAEWLEWRERKQSAPRRPPAFRLV